MNSDIVPQGPSELVTGPATIARPVLIAKALEVCNVANVAYLFPATPANAAAVTGFATLPVLAELTNVKSFTLTSGTMSIMYRR